MLSDHVHGKPSLTLTSLHALGFGHTKSILFPTTVAQMEHTQCIRHCVDVSKRPSFNFHSNLIEEPRGDEAGKRSNRATHAINGRLRWVQRSSHLCYLVSRMNGPCHVG